MPQRDRVVEDWTRMLAEHQGINFHFQFSEPVVTTKDGEPLEPEAYYVLSDLAEAMYDALLNRLDYNRLCLNAVGALYALDYPGEPGVIYDDPRYAGAALRAALSVTSTGPSDEEYRTAAGPMKEYLP